MTEETKQTLGALWGAALGGTFEHLRKFLAVYAVFTMIFGAIGTTTWKVFFKPALAAEMKQELKEQLNAPCLKGEDGKRQNTLACNIEADTQAIQDLNSRFDAYIEAQGQLEVKRAQENEQIIRLLQGLQRQ